MKPRPSAIKVQAEQLSLPVYQPERIRDEPAQARIRDLGADVMVVAAYGQILPAALLEAPRLGSLNVHASLLPRHRGAAPVEWAILSGDPKTGVTIMQMDAGVDTGPILAQEAIAIGPKETAGALEDRLADLGGRLLVRSLARFEAGDLRAHPQGSEGATRAPRLSSEDGNLDPTTMSAEEMDRRVRALGERIGTWLKLKGSEIKVIRGHVDGDADSGIPVPTANGTYVVDEVQPPGGRRMSAQTWLRGRR
jgi:methionyl-tRNA formyltransferase